MMPPGSAPPSVKPVRTTFFVFVLALAALVTILQLANGAALLFERDLNEHLRRAEERRRAEASTEGVEGQATGMHVRVAVGSGPILVNNERQLSIARGSGVLFLTTSAIAGIGLGLLWRMRRLGFWLFAIGALGFAAANWRFEGTADLEEIVSSSVTLGYESVLVALLALHWKRLG